ncbi:MAG TPA: hypothetical protein VK648_08340 [Gemmatimonadaceae bacterium]|nr:hypothetical protein [Gemmatimonadaceae bacterium]
MFHGFTYVFHAQKRGTLRLRDATPVFVACHEVIVPSWPGATGESATGRAMSNTGHGSRSSARTLEPGACEAPAAGRNQAMKGTFLVLLLGLGMGACK